MKNFGVSVRRVHKYTL